MLRGLGIAIAAAVTVAVGTVTAAASTRATDSITGIEVAGSSSQGTFLGAATGDLPGTWHAVVRHAPLPRRAEGHAAITGGTFSLATVVGGHAATVRGNLRRGARGITLATAGTHCRDQTFRIRARLGRVGIATRDGVGRLAATLTHYRTRIFGRCITYSASVAGSVNLTFG